MADELEIVEKLAGRLPPVDSIGEMEKALVGAIGSHFPELGASERAAMAKKIASYGPIAEFMEDPAVEDVMINGLNPIFIYRSDSGDGED